MQQNQSRITVYFEDPFWVCVYERISGGVVQVCKITFGSQPADGLVYRMLLDNWRHLSFSKGVPGAERPQARPSPKRASRLAHRQMQTKGVATAAQQALQQQRELQASERREKQKEHRKAWQQRQFELRTQKRKQKHKGH